MQELQRLFRLADRIRRELLEDTWMSDRDRQRLLSKLERTSRLIEQQQLLLCR